MKHFEVIISLLVNYYQVKDALIGYWDMLSDLCRPKMLDWLSLQVIKCFIFFLLFFVVWLTNISVSHFYGMAVTVHVSFYRSYTSDVIGWFLTRQVQCQYPQIKLFCLLASTYEHLVFCKEKLFIFMLSNVFPTVAINNSSISYH